MPRKVKDRNLDSREARLRLKPRGRPYYRSLDKKLHLGYRRLRGTAGTWWARHYVGDQEYKMESIGVADDLSDADGMEILDYWQAQDKARGRMVVRTTASKAGPLTVKAAVEEYLQWLESMHKPVYDPRRRAETLMYPTLGEIECSALSTETINRWLIATANVAPRVRTRPGDAQQYRKFDSKDPDVIRRRRASTNRVFTILQAALNQAWQAGKIPTDEAWRRAKPFKGVNVARVRYLKSEEAQRLVNAVDPEFRPMVQAALLTGCRYGELCALQVHDFDANAGAIHIRRSKSGKPRHVMLTEEGIALFTQLSLGREGPDLMLRCANGRAFRKSQQRLPMEEACDRAHIRPRVSFHILRHTWASLSVMAGMPLTVVAHNLGHSNTRVTEKHYGHLAPSYIAEEVRKSAPRFGFKPDRKVAAI